MCIKTQFAGHLPLQMPNSPATQVASLVGSMAMRRGSKDAVDSQKRVLTRLATRCSSSPFLQLPTNFRRAANTASEDREDVRCVSACALSRAREKACSCFSWSFSGRNWATDTRKRDLSLRSRGRAARWLTLQGGYTSDGLLRVHHS